MSTVVFCSQSFDLCMLHAAGNQSCGEDPNGAIRLVGGSNFYEGRVEICLDGEWGTVCDTFWTDLDAVVVCRQLSFGLSDATARTGAFYGQGNGSIHLDRFFCSGVEERITDCIHAPATDDACSHSRDAGVTCSGQFCVIHFILVMRTVYMMWPVVTVTVMDALFPHMQASNAQTVMCDWLMVRFRRRVALKFASTTSFRPSVTTFGMLEMLQWSADS